MRVRSVAMEIPIPLGGSAHHHLRVIDNMYQRDLVKASIDAFDLIYGELNVVVGKESLLCLHH